MKTEPQRSRWSWSVGRMFGITIRIHITLLALFAWVATSYVIGGSGPGEATFGVVLVALVFAIIVLHELGHALVARRYGCTTREILLLPIGGLAQMDRMPDRPAQELLVALAGPAVNIGFAIILALVMTISGASFDPALAATMSGALVSQLLWINIGLALFNLLPAFPMDGGRVLRAVLAIRLGRARATRIAGGIGRVLAVGFAIIGLLFSPMLVLIGVFVWFASQQETASVELRSILAGVSVERAMIRNPEVVGADESIEHVAERMLAGGQHQLAVLHHGALVGAVTAADVATSLAAPGPHGAIAAIVHTDIPVVDSDDPLESAMESLDRNGVAFVVHRDELVGLLTTEQLATFAAFHSQRTSAPPPTLATS